jgi:hypothetical protein
VNRRNLVGIRDLLRDSSQIVKSSRVSREAAAGRGEISRVPRRSVSFPRGSICEPTWSGSSQVAATACGRRPDRAGGQTIVQALGLDDGTLDRSPSRVRARPKPSVCSVNLDRPGPGDGPARLHLARRECDLTPCSSDFHFLRACRGRGTGRLDFPLISRRAYPASDDGRRGRTMGSAARFRVGGAVRVVVRPRPGAGACGRLVRTVASGECRVRHGSCASNSRWAYFPLRGHGRRRQAWARETKPTYTAQEAAKHSGDRCCSLCHALDGEPQAHQLLLGGLAVIDSFCHSTDT